MAFYNTGTIESYLEYVGLVAEALFLHHQIQESQIQIQEIPPLRNKQKHTSHLVLNND